MGEERVWIRSSEPILPVADVIAAVRYYRSVLGFTHEWVRGNPPDSGGVRWGKVGVIFAQPSGHHARIEGQCHLFLVEGIDSLHAFHYHNGATICSPMDSKPWGLREYTVRDPDGHYLRFGQRASDRTTTAGRPPAVSVAILERMPTPDEHRRLSRAVGWASHGQSDRTEEILAGARIGVVAVEGDEIVGAGLVVGDGTTFAYLRDIVVLPEWQGRGVGTRLVEALLAILRRSVTDAMLVTLFTGQHLAEFYERFGFCGPEKLYGMTLIMEGRATTSTSSSE